jgi:cytochrome c biogenesis protein CcdA/glutaredoxin
MRQGFRLIRQAGAIITMLVLLQAALALCAGPVVGAQDASTPDDAGVSAEAAADLPKVRMLIFKSEDCPECVEALEMVLPDLEREYPGQIEVEQLEIGEADPNRIENVTKLFALEEKFGDTGNEVPVIFVGQYVIGGPDEVRERLPEIVPEILVQGGCDYPVLTAEELAVASRVEQGSKCLAYFDQPGCKDCDRVTYLLLYLEKHFPSLDLRQYDITVRENKVLNEAMCLARNVPQHQRLVVPAVFIGDGHLVENEITWDAVKKLLNTPAAAEPAWNVSEEQLAKARASIGGRFRSLKVVTVAAAGLLDGVNPCAFATIIFFISYLAMIGRKGRELISVGAAFSAAVFLTYLAIGFGFFEFLQSIADMMRTLSLILYIVIAVIAFVIGVVSVYDFVLIRRGDLRDMKLQLPAALKRRIQLTISKRSRMRNYLVGAVVAGAVVSLLELACTGQVYLPTITWAVQDPALRPYAYRLLVVYNLMFVTPLVAIIVLTYYGLSSQQLASFLQKRAAVVKLATAAFFFGMAGILLYNIIP